MTDAPETIWSSGKMNGALGDCWLDCSNHEMPGCEIKYRRADLPPTLEQAFAVPEVKALVEGLRDIARQKPASELETEGDFEVGYDGCVYRARAALAALEGKG